MNNSASPAPSQGCLDNYNGYLPVMHQLIATQVIDQLVAEQGRLQAEFGGSPQPAQVGLVVARRVAEANIKAVAVLLRAAHAKTATLVCEGGSDEGGEPVWAHVYADRPFNQAEAEQQAMNYGYLAQRLQVPSLDWATHTDGTHDFAIAPRAPIARVLERWMQELADWEGWTHIADGGGGIFEVDLVSAQVAFQPSPSDRLLPESNGRGA